jgi:hypothetical protein
MLQAMQSADSPTAWTVPPTRQSAKSSKLHQEPGSVQKSAFSASIPTSKKAAGMLISTGSTSINEDGLSYFIEKEELNLFQGAQ